MSSTTSQFSIHRPRFNHVYLQNNSFHSPKQVQFPVLPLNSNVSIPTSISHCKFLFGLAFNSCFFYSQLTFWVLGFKGLSFHYLCAFLGSFLQLGALDFWCVNVLQRIFQVRLKRIQFRNMDSNQIR